MSAPKTAVIRYLAVILLLVAAPRVRLAAPEEEVIILIRLHLTEELERQAKDLQAVMPLHSNLLHILTLKNGSQIGGWKGIGGETKILRRFSELKGVKVAVVSSALLVGQKLNNQLGYGMELFEAVKLATRPFQRELYTLVP